MDKPHVPAGCVLKERYAFVFDERAAGKTWAQIGALLGVSKGRAIQLAKEARDGLARTYYTPEDLAQQDRWRRERAERWRRDDASGLDLDLD